MKYFFLIPIITSATLCSAQKAPDLSCVNATQATEHDKKIEIYFYSDARCGFCRRAFKNIGEWAEGKSVKLIALDLYQYSDPEAPDALYSKYHIEIRDASECAAKYKKLIPLIYVRDAGTEETLAKFRGWIPEDIEKLNRKLADYL
jgi:hypothetical protein